MSLLECDVMVNNFDVVGDILGDRRDVQLHGLVFDKFTEYRTRKPS